MRHRSIETTLKYYVAQDADEVADELWNAFSEGNEANGPEDMDLPPPRMMVSATLLAHLC